MRTVIIPEDSDHVTRELCSARTSGEFVFSVYDKAQSENLPALIFSHSHPQKAYFSDKDERDTAIHLKVLGDFNIRYYVRIVVGSDGLVADLHRLQKHGGWSREVIDCIILYRRSGIDIIVPNNSVARFDNVDSELHNRTLQIGGGIERALQMIKALKLIVIGIGGIGNTFLHLYKHLDPKNLVLVDFDVLEKSNGNRYLGYRPGDNGRPKVEITKRELLEFNPDLQIETYQESFPSRDTREAFKSSDFVIATPDNHMTRLVVSELCSQYCKPLLSGWAGIYVDDSGKPYRMSCSTWFQLPLGPCLRCLGLKSDFAPEYSEMVTAAKQSYIKGFRDPGPTPASVITLHAQCANLLVRHILYYLSDISDEQIPLHLVFDEIPISNAFQDLTPLFPRNDNCPICGNRGYWSYGDSAPGIPSKEELEAEVAQMPQKRTQEEQEPVKNAKYSELEFLIDLTALAHEGRLSEKTGRDKEIEQTILVLSRKTKPNPLLVGEPGVGKTAVVEGLAQRIVSGDVPDGFPVTRILQLDLVSMFAGAGTMVEGKLIQILEFAHGNGKALFIDEIHMVMEARGAVPLADSLKPLIASGEMRVIVATTIMEARKIEADGAFDRRFARIIVEEPTAEQTIEILRGITPEFQSHHGVAIEDAALERIVPLACRHIPQRRFPDRAIDILDTSFSLCRIRGDAVVTEEHVLEVVERISGIPAQRLGMDDARLLELNTFLAQRIIGQEEAIEAFASALRVKHAGLTDGGPPGFIFTGPSGTGKTQTALCAAEFLFGTPDALIRLDMSEFQEQHTVSRMLGAPPMWGYERGGTLTEAVENKPFSIILWDEVEKAHQDVYNILLQILDYGRLKDSSGTSTNFAETIVILTSNVPHDQLKAFFRPELLGRLSRNFASIRRRNQQASLHRVLGAVY